MIKVYSHSEAETEEIGKKLGQIVERGTFIALTGDLGAGKTAFTRGIARGLGIDDYITSPTFTLIHEYQGRLPLYHFDVYRIDDPGEMLEIGYEDYFYGDGVTVVEWSQKVEELLPEERLEVEITNGLEENEREIVFTAMGEKYGNLEKEMKNA